MTLTDDTYLQARELIAHRFGLDFPDNRRASLEQALLQSFRKTSFSMLDVYLTHLRHIPTAHPQWRDLLDTLTVGETYFFRDRAVFTALEQQVLPALIARRRAAHHFYLRLWSAGCATGEEPYSLAILLDALLPDRPRWSVTILATDISPDALARARRGVYRAWAFRQPLSERQQRYFRAHSPTCVELDPRIRGMVTFATLNMATDSYPAVATYTSAMDVILCRNVLMYLTQAAQQAAIAQLEQALTDSGWLVVSPAEASTNSFRAFACVNFPGAVFYRKAQTRIQPPLSTWHAHNTASIPQQRALMVDALDRDYPGQPEVLPLAQAVEEVPTPSTVLQRARAYADQGKLEQARQLCQIALDENRLDSAAYILLAAIAQEQGARAEALQALRQAIYVDPQAAPAYFLLGNLFHQQGDVQQAQQYMRIVVRLLRPRPPQGILSSDDGLTVGRLLAAAQGYLES